MSVFTRTRIINIPKLGFKRNGHVDWGEISSVAFGTLAFVLIAIILGALTFDMVRWMVRKPSPPPKVITKTVYLSALSDAQRHYINDCEAQTTTYTDGGGDQHNNYGIPNVEVNPWTCTFAK